MRTGCLAIWILALVACGDDTPEVKQPFLWEVQSEAGSTFLLGTIHIGVGAEDLPDIVWQAYDESQTVVVESDTRSSVTSDQLDAVSLPEGQSLSSMMSDKMWGDLTTTLDSSTPEALDRLQPWVVSAMLAGRLRPEGDAMDLTFTLSAAEQERELVFLEQFEEVATKLEDIPLEQSVMDIAVMLYRADDYVASIQRLVQLYRWGDVATMQEEMWGVPQEVEQPAGEQPEGEPADGEPADGEPADGSASDEILLRQRNLEWFPVIEQRVRAGGSFIAVGLAHLIGPYNLIDMLADEGYQPLRVLAHSQLGTREAALRPSAAYLSRQLPQPARAALYRAAE